MTFIFKLPIKAPEADDEIHHTLSSSLMMTMCDCKGNLDDSYMSKSNRGDNCDVSDAPLISSFPRSLKERKLLLKLDVPTITTARGVNVILFCLMWADVAAIMSIVKNVHNDE